MSNRRKMPRNALFDQLATMGSAAAGYTQTYAPGRTARGRFRMTGVPLLCPAV